jgi:hypothetical protein
MRSLEIIFGNRRAPDNAFRFKRVCLNLPGNEGYDPSRPWGFKQREDGSNTSNVHVYVTSTLMNLEGLQTCSNTASTRLVTTRFTTTTLLPAPHRSVS